MASYVIIECPMDLKKLDLAQLRQMLLESLETRQGLTKQGMLQHACSWSLILAELVNLPTWKCSSFQKQKRWPWIAPRTAASSLPAVLWCHPPDGVMWKMNFTSLASVSCNLGSSGEWPSPGLWPMSCHMSFLCGWIPLSGKRRKKSKRLSVQTNKIKKGRLSSWKGMRGWTRAVL